MVGGANLLRSLDWLKAANMISLDSLPADLERRMRDSAYDSVSPVGSWRLDRIEQAPAGIYAAEFARMVAAKVSRDESFGTLARLRCENVFAR